MRKDWQIQTKRKNMIKDIPKNFEKKLKIFRFLNKIGLEIIKTSWISVAIFAIGLIFTISSIFIITIPIIIGLFIFIIGIILIIMAYIYRRKLVS